VKGSEAFEIKSSILLFSSPCILSGKLVCRIKNKCILEKMVGPDPVCKKECVHHLSWADIFCLFVWVQVC
jgi:hypothetical protein